MNLIRVSQVDKHNLPFKASTFYAWWHKKRHPEIFIKSGRALFVDVETLNAMLEAGRGR